MEFQLCCEVCGKSASNGHTLYRSGKKGAGVNPHWRCSEHMNMQEVSPDVREVVEAVEVGNTPTDKGS